MGVIGMTLCSGIGAPEIAAPWIDWRLASEIEAFPRAVLQHRFGYRTPTGHNQGDPLLWSDMTEVSPELLRQRGIPLPEIIVAGTPCQAFSAAGLRQGLEDPRGNLTLAFVEILHAIVAARPDGRLIAVWENVPGVLSDRGNAFGCFLGGLVGAMDALRPPGDGSWPGEGMVEGPRARAAWSVLDAQWFGVAQRRRRAFVVVDFGGAVDPAAVLLEPDRLRGDSPTRREAGEGTTLSIAPSIRGRSNASHRLDSDAYIASTGHVSHCLRAGGMGRQDFETETLVAHSLRGEGFDASEDGTGRGTPIVPVQGVAIRGREGGGTLELTGDIATALRASTGGGDKPHVLAPISVFDPNQITSKTNRSVPTPELCHTLPGAPNASIAFTSKGFGADAAVDLSPTLRAGGHAGGPVPPAIATDWAVRRLTPTECHRLQGFSDDHCDVPWRGKPGAPDGPQYKALGNSMAVPVMRWILDRVRISAAVASQPQSPFDGAADMIIREAE